ncbi:MAG TPA: efflux RND transporter periplasmic adaptor subunit, partial [Nitrospirales bacterium]|nr:efflux RND transporter periplasmic adaptor subunit [Nitrospirales bacterium]
PTRRDVAYTITLPANVAPLYQTTLYAKVSGYLKWIGPDKGDLVKRGQLLAVIDAPEVEEQYHQAVAEYKIKKLTYERMANVWKETPDVIAKQDVDMAEAAYQGAKHQMEQREALRNYAKVVAPYTGVITARFADPGALIQVATSSATSAIPLFTIMDLDTVRIYASVPQEDSPWIKTGTPAQLKVRELPDRVFTGTVTRSTQSLDPSTRSLLIEVDLPNPEHALQPGTFGELTLQLRVSANTLVVPAGAITSQSGRTFVFIVEQDAAAQRPVKTGLSDGRWTEIVEGLSGTESVVVVGKSNLVPGTRVQSRPYTLPAGTMAIQKYSDRRPNP